MKKTLAILALIASTSALAGGAGVMTEFEVKNGKDGNSDSRSISVAPYYKFDNGVKADLKLEGSRDTGTVAGNNKDISGAVEARVFRAYDLTPRLSAGVRLGVGQKLNGTSKAGVTEDFGYYTIEPIAHYDLTDRVGLHVSYRYRNAFDANDYAFKTNTAKVGLDYALTKQDTVGIKYVETYGDSRSNGVEFKYVRGF